MKIFILMIVFAVFSAGCTAEEKVEVPELKDTVSNESTAERIKVANAPLAPENSKTIDVKKSIEPEMKRCGFKTGIIKYESTGFATGTQILYFKDWGFRNAISQERLLNGQHIAERIIMLEDYIYQINAAAKRYIRTPNKDVLAYIKIYQKVKDNEKADSLFMLENHAKYLGTEKIAGKLCAKWDVPNGNAINWKWKGIILKSVMNLPIGKLTYEAVDIQVDVPVPDLLFELPNVEYIDKE